MNKKYLCVASILFFSCTYEEILENVDNLITNTDAYTDLLFLCKWEIKIDFFHKTNDRVIYGLQF